MVYSVNRSYDCRTLLSHSFNMFEYVLQFDVPIAHRLLLPLLPVLLLPLLPLPLWTVGHDDESVKMCASSIFMARQDDKNRGQNNKQQLLYEILATSKCIYQRYGTRHGERVCETKSPRQG